MKRILLTTFFLLILQAVPRLSLAQSGNPDPILSVKSGSSKALHDLLATEKKSAECADLFQDYILPNPFHGDPQYDLPIWYQQSSAFHFRPEAGVFMYTPAGGSPPPPTLCLASELAEADSFSTSPHLQGLGFDPEQLQQWLIYCPPRECARIHRQLSFSTSSPDSLAVLLEILSRWDPGPSTLSLVFQAGKRPGMPPQAVQMWTDRIFYTHPSQKRALTHRLPLPLEPLRSLTYQRLLSVYPFVYDEEVDYYGRALSQSNLKSIPPFAPIYDLLNTRHSRALYYLTAQAYRLHLDHAEPSQIDYIAILRQLTGMDIVDRDLKGWLIHFYSASADWVWSDQQQRFYYYPEMKDHQILVESWFRYLASPDPDIALTFYRQIIDADPTIVRQYSGSFRQLLSQWNPILPPASLPFPEITATFRTAAREREQPLQLPTHQDELAQLLQESHTLTRRIDLEDSLIRLSHPEDIPAWEATGLEWVAFPEAEQSISRIVDALYHQQPPLQGPAGKRETYLQKAGVFLDPDRGDAASRYMERIKDEWSEEEARSWMIHSINEDSRNAVRSIQGQQTIDRFIRRPGQLQPEEIFQLPPPEALSDSVWVAFFSQPRTPVGQLRIIQYFRLHPREFHTGELLRIWPKWIASASPDHPLPEESLLQLLEYMTGLYNLAQPMDWWMNHWRRGQESWPGMLNAIYTDYLLELNRSKTIPPIQISFLLRQLHEEPLEQQLWQSAIQQWEDPSRATTLPFQHLDVHSDLPYFLSLGISASRIADMAPRFNLDDPDHGRVFLENLLAASVDDQEKAELANRLFMYSWYRELLLEPDLVAIRNDLSAILTTSLEEAMWLSAFEEANTWAQIVWCQSVGAPEQWLGLITRKSGDPSLQAQVFQQLIRNLTFPQLQRLLLQLTEWEPAIRDPLVDILLRAFALPPLDLDSATPYRDALLHRQLTSAQDIYVVALGSLSNRFTPPLAAEQQEEWIYSLLSSEYIRPLFGYHPTPRLFPTLPVLAWWIGEQQGEEALMNALREYRQTGDLYALVRAAQLHESSQMKRGVNSLFTPG